MSQTRPANREIADQFDLAANVLAARGAPARRTNVYRRGAIALRMLAQPVTTILHTMGLAGLFRIPGIGEKLARAVRRVATTGQLPIRLRPDESVEHPTGTSRD